MRQRPDDAIQNLIEAIANIFAQKPQHMISVLNCVIGSSRITMDVYAEALTPPKRNAQGKVVAMLRETKKEKRSWAKSCASLCVPAKNPVSSKSF